MKIRFLIIGLVGLLWVSRAEARSFALEGPNAYSGGIGFQAGLTRWTPGGFKFFNDYSRELTRIVWLNFQFNGSVGEMGPRHCKGDPKKDLRCDYHHWDGGDLQIAIGVKLVWNLKKLPIQMYGKIGGIADILFLGEYYTGVTLGVRGGVGAHYFFTPSFGVGAELMASLGPSILPGGPSVEFYAALDFQIIGIEFRW